MGRVRRIKRLRPERQSPLFPVDEFSLQADVRIDQAGAPQNVLTTTAETAGLGVGECGQVIPLINVSGLLGRTNAVRILVRVDGIQRGGRSDRAKRPSREGAEYVDIGPARRASAIFSASVTGRCDFTV